MNTLNDAIVGLVLVGILIGIWSLYNIWIGCEEDRLEELLEEEHSIPPKTVRNLSSYITKNSKIKTFINVTRTKNGSTYRDWETLKIGRAHV